MSDPVRCGGCGRELNSEVTTAVQAAIDGWVAAGLLGADQAQALRSGSPVHRRARLSPGVVILSVGGVFVLSAAIMVVANLWDRIGFGARLAIVLAPMIALYAGAIIASRSQGVSRLVPALLALFGAALAPAASWLILCEVRMPFPCVLHGEMGDASPARVCATALVSLVIHAATLWRFRHPLLTLPVCGSALFVLPAATEWLLPHSASGRNVSLAILLTGCGLMLSGRIAQRRWSASYAVVPDLVGSMTALMATTTLGAESGGAWEVLAGAAPLAVIALGCHPERQRYLVAGLLFLTVNIFRIGLERFGRTAGLPITLLVCGAVVMAIGYGVHRVRREFATQALGDSGSGG